jgi:hypothetical protein
MLYHIIVLTYRLADVETLAGELRVQFLVECPETASVVHVGTSSTLRHGFLVIEWLASGDELDEDLLYQLEHDDRVADVCPFPLPMDEDAASLFGSAGDEYDAGKQQQVRKECTDAAAVPAVTAPTNHCG